MTWLQPKASVIRQKVKDRIVVVSIPKSGTYLLSELLKETGFIQTYMHLGMTWVDIYDRTRLEEGRKAPSKFRHQLRLEDALARVPVNGFAVGHLMHSREMVQLLSGFKLIFLKRDLRSCIVSHLRFLSQTSRVASRSYDWHREADQHKQLVMFIRSVGSWLFTKYYEKMVGWNDTVGVSVIKFEDLICENLVVIQELLDVLDCRHQVTKGCMASVIAADTLTKSSTPSRWQSYWSEEAETLFRKFRGNELNAKLGYSDGDFDAAAVTAPYCQARP